MKTVVGFFDDLHQAEKAVQDLESAGIARDDISVVSGNKKGQVDTRTEPSAAGETTTEEKGSETAKGAVAGGVTGFLIGLISFAIPGLGAVAGLGWLVMTLIGAGVGAVVGLAGALTHAGIPHEEATYYEEGVRRGGTLVLVKTPDEEESRINQILSNDGAINIHERAAQWRQEGWQPATAAATAAATTPPATTPSPQTQTPVAASPQATLNQEGKATIPVIQEEMQVGKKEVETGGVRVTSQMTEQPVEQQVPLREEHVTVERHPVDRPVSVGDMAAFQEGTIEVKETAEEPIVNKQARVVEEVVVGKEVTERTETVQDTVRHTQVDAQPLGAEHVSRTRGFDTYQTDFRNDFNTNYANQGMTYEQYLPAYEYGYNRANDAGCQGKDWAAIAPTVRQDWENQQPGTWDRYQNAIRYAWEKGRSGIETGGQDFDGTPDTRGIMEKAADAVTGDRIDDKTGKPVA